MKIIPETLKHYRKLKSLSQADLSNASHGKVSIATVKRIENAKEVHEANPRTVKTIAEVLKIYPEMLAETPQAPVDQDNHLRSFGYRPLKTAIDGETALAFQAVEERYGLPIRSQILMAPLFATLLAEGSLAWRRQKLDEVENANANLMALGQGHLSFALVASRVEDGCREEDASIEDRDLFGNRLAEDSLTRGYNLSRRNPFADYLYDFARTVGADVKFDPDELGEWKTPEGLPEYQVASDYIAELTGGDYRAEFALLQGHARINDIPKDLRTSEKKQARLEWFLSKLPAQVRAQLETRLEDLDLSDLDLRIGGK